MTYPITVEQIQIELGALHAALSQGVLKVRTRSGDGEKEVQYPSAADLMSRIAYLDGLLNRANRSGISVTVGTFSGGRGR